MNDVQMLKNVNNAINNIDKYKFAEAVIALEEIKAELTLRTLKSAAVKSVSVIKAAQKFAKFCAKADVLKGCDGANSWTDEYGDEHEYITDGYHMVVYDKPFGDVLVRSNFDGRNFESILRSAKEQKYTVVMPSYKELKRISTAARQTKVKEPKIVLENGTCVMLGYLLQIMECVGIADECADDVTEWHNDSRINAMYIHRGDAHGLVMPVRCDMDSASIVKDYSAGQMKEGN